MMSEVTLCIGSSVTICPAVMEPSAWVTDCESTRDGRDCRNGGRAPGLAGRTAGVAVPVAVL
jgi:hypothetical protein